MKRLSVPIIFFGLTGYYTVDLFITWSSASFQEFLTFVLAGPADISGFSSAGSLYLLSIALMLCASAFLFFAEVYRIRLGLPASLTLLLTLCSVATKLLYRLLIRKTPELTELLDVVVVFVILLLLSDFFAGRSESKDSLY